MANEFSMIELFRTELQNQVAILSNGLLALESDPRSKQTLEQLMRASHSIKGAARIVGVEPVVKISHVMEDCFVAAQNEKIMIQPEHIDILLKTTDWLVKISQVSEGELNDWFTEHKQEIDGLILTLEDVKACKNPDKPKSILQPLNETLLSHTDTSVQEKKTDIKADEKQSKIPPKKDNIIDISMIELFRAEAQSQASILSNGLLALESDPRSKQNLEQLMRASHSIKGAARIVGVTPVVKISHVMEDCFVAAQNEKIIIQSGHVDVLLKATDWLIKISQVSEGELNDWLAEHKQEIDDLALALEDVKAGKSLDKPKPIPHEKIFPSPSQDISNQDASAITGIFQIPSSSSVNAPISVNMNINDRLNTGIFEKPTSLISNESALSLEAKPELKTRKIVKHELEKDESGELSVRVSSDNLGKLTGLVGETVVRAKRLESYSKSLFLLQRRQKELQRILKRLHKELNSIANGAYALELLNEGMKKTDECFKITRERITDINSFSQGMIDTSDRVYQQAISLRMRPFADGVEGFPRMVRDLARDLGKKVKFEIIGRDVRVDREILEKLEAPLTHLLRNSLDHGLENSQQRIAVKKKTEGTLKLEARHQAGRLHIIVSDDGQGVNLERVRRKILGKGLATEEVLVNLSESELLEFLFLPGFSTSENVTEISGRGVGLDVVHTVIHGLGGGIRIENKPGQGVTFHLELPIARSVLRALVVDISGDPYALPLAQIEHLIMVGPEDIKTIEDRQYVNYSGKNIGLINAQQVLDLPSSQFNGNSWMVVVLSDKYSCYGLKIDRIRGEFELVVRPIDPRLGKIQDISAVSLMDDGSPVLILDIDDIMRSTDKILSTRKLEKIGSRTATRMLKRKRILVVDDSITVREMERRLLDSHGYQVDVAIDGMDGWNTMLTGRYDLLISDIDMPRMNGIDFVIRLRQDERFRGLPIMLVSYKDSPEDRVRGLQAGANYYFTKSGFHDETFINAVVNLIGEGIDEIGDR